VAQGPLQWGEKGPSAPLRRGMEKLYEGKAKVLYREGPDTLRVYFKDEATAFNAQKRGVIPGKGVVNNKVSAALFRYLEAHGVKTHFLEEVSDREMRVRRVEILPLEVILRFRAAGSFARRYGLKEGTPLKMPLLEFSLKNDALGDPLICENAVLALGLTTEGGESLLADEISPDTMRLWDEKGEPLDKDRFRKDLGGVEEAYREVLRRVLG